MDFKDGSLIINKLNEPKHIIKFPILSLSILL